MGVTMIALHPLSRIRQDLWVWKTPLASWMTCSERSIGAIQAMCVVNKGSPDHFRSHTSRPDRLTIYTLELTLLDVGLHYVTEW